jgi:ABC-2 type transport system ATP-binding protein
LIVALSLAGSEEKPLGENRLQAAAEKAGSGLAPRLRFRGLRQRFGDRVAVDGLTLSLHAGEVLGLLGPNGSGKSTALRVLTGLLVPEAGTIELDGQVVTAGGRALRRRMGVVFQSPSVDARLTVRENLELSAALYGIRGKDGQARIDDVLGLAALRERASDRISELWGGMKRRLELARALLHEPSLLVMDEPTTGLDESSFRQVWERIERMRRDLGLTVLLSTHRADEAERCDRVAVLDQGKVIAEGAPEALRARLAGDVITLEGKQPEQLCEDLNARLGLQASVVGGRVVLERERGHELVPRIVEALPAGRIESISMHRPTLADLFVKLTGRGLDADTAAGKEA